MASTGINYLTEREEHPCWIKGQATRCCSSYCVSEITLPWCPDTNNLLSVFFSSSSMSAWQKAMMCVTEVISQLAFCSSKPKHLGQRQTCGKKIKQLKESFPPPYRPSHLSVRHFTVLPIIWSNNLIIGGRLDSCGMWISGRRRVTTSNKALIQDGFPCPCYCLVEFNVNKMIRTHFNSRTSHSFFETLITL